MDIYERLMADHARQRRLVQELLQVTSEPAKALPLLMQLQDEVEAHEAAEEQTLYAEILALSKDATRVSGSVAEHDAIALLTAQLVEAEPDFDGWTSGLKALAECLVLHLDNEETMVFSYARTIIGADCAVALAQRFEAVKEAEVDVWGNAGPTPPGARWAEPAAAE